MVQELVWNMSLDFYTTAAILGRMCERYTLNSF